MLAGLVDVGRMAKRSITLEVQIRESNREQMKTQRELQAASGTVLEAQHLPLSNSGKTCSCRQQWKGQEKQLDVVREKVISVEAENVESAVRSKRESKSLQRE